MINERINNSFFYYTDSQVIHTREYYNYIVGLIKKWLSSTDKHLNVILGNYFFDFKNDNETIKIDIQCEHTLVKEGGRSVNNKIYGKIKNSDGYYLVRIDKFHYLNSLNYVIEYSLPNIKNISSCDIYKDYLSKVIYISPTLYEPNFLGTKTEVITLFDYSSNLRRASILSQMDNIGIKNTIVTNCFSNECLEKLYKKTKIMVNVHQTDHHHTFEELRVLPSLLNGVIIISEDVPLKEEIPYGEFIIWSDYNDIPKKTLEVIENYDFYYDKIFNNSKLMKILNEMKNENEQAFMTL